MSWQLAAYAILGLGLVGGFAWYERAKPDARVVALVATLAAFAALGRIAFAAVPNVKPTTDIVLISGYALGGGPGFVVGAVAGLTSNFFFGQGPWTPWQMAAWGVCGLIGAGLAPLTRRRIGRWPLAIVCFVVGFAFTATQDFGDWVTYSDHGLAQLGVYVGKGLGFDLIHATGCLLFALAFGPALARSIERFTRRLTVTWLPAGRGLVLIGLTAGAVGSLAVQGGGLGQARAAETPVQYLLGAQNGDGGYGPAPGQPSTQLYAGWAALGLASEGYNPGVVTRGGLSLLDYVRAGVGSISDAGTLERTILVARAAGASASSFGGRDLITELDRDIEGNGSVANQTAWTAFAVLALRSAGVAPPARMLAWLVRQHDTDGGFNFATAGSTSDVDDTGAALEALAGDGAARSVIVHAVRFLRREQNGDGGFPSEPGATSNAQSTAFAVQGLIAVGTPLSSMPHGSPDRYLNGLVGASGAIAYARGAEQSPVWVTGEAVMALAGKPLPLAPVPPPASATHTAHHGRKRQRHARTAHVATHHSHPGRRSRVVRKSPLTLPNLDDLAAAAGVVTALALAPVGG